MLIFNVELWNDRGVDATIVRASLPSTTISNVSLSDEILQMSRKKNKTRHTETRILHMHTRAPLHAGSSHFCPGLNVRTRMANLYDLLRKIATTANHHNLLCKWCRQRDAAQCTRTAFPSFQPDLCFLKQTKHQRNISFGRVVTMMLYK